MTADFLVLLLHNQATDTYHPVYFRCAPLPGSLQGDSVVRYKSGGHHTAGFPTLEAGTDGRQQLVDALNSCGYGRTKIMDLVAEWDGEGIPAMVQLFRPSDVDVE